MSTSRIPKVLVERYLLLEFFLRYAVIHDDAQCPIAPIMSNATIFTVYFTVIDATTALSFCLIVTIVDSRTSCLFFALPPAICHCFCLLPLAHTSLCVHRTLPNLISHIERTAPQPQIYPIKFGLTYFVLNEARPRFPTPRCLRSCPFSPCRPSLFLPPQPKVT